VGGGFMIYQFAFLLTSDLRIAGAVMVSLWNRPLLGVGAVPCNSTRRSDRRDVTPFFLRSNAPPGPLNEGFDSHVTVRS